MNRNSALLVLCLTGCATTTPSSPFVADRHVQPAYDPLSFLSGEWRVVNIETNAVIRDCKNAQSIRVAPDRKTVLLTEKGPDGSTTRYMVLRNEKGRVLMFIEDEVRKTKRGDPILWWAILDGPDRFYWRRYDWEPDSRTVVEWRRCPAI